jgi:hypothetical protein
MPFGVGNRYLIFMLFIICRAVCCHSSFSLREQLNEKTSALPGSTKY